MNQLNQNLEEQPENKDAANVPASPFRRIASSFWRAIVDRQIFYKIFSLFFALLVFGYVYLYMEHHRDLMTYMGLMLLMVVVYIEVLVIRDHLWVIEGSMRESRKWRDVFFNRTTLRRQRIRKIAVLIYALAIFSYVYMKVPRANSPVLSFMGIILMITVLYSEVLTIRDEVLLMRESLSHLKEEGPEKTDHDKFLAEKNEAEGKQGQPEKK